MKKIILLIILVSILVSSCKVETEAGGTIISLQQTNFRSNDPSIQGDAWLLTMVQNGASQFAVGSFQAEDITDGDSRATRDLQVTLENSPQKCQYDIMVQNNEFLYNVEKVSIGSVVFASSQQGRCNDQCFSQGGWFCGTVGFNAFKGGWQMECIMPTITATYGTVPFDKLEFQSTIIANVDGEEFRGTISNSAQQSVWMSQGRVQASWIGNLVSGQDCPRASTRDVVALRIANTWRLTSESRWDFYKAYHSAGFTSCVENIRLDSLLNFAKTQACIDIYNTRASSALISKQFAASGGEVATARATSGGQGQATIELGKDIQFPTFTMRIRADILGIFIPVGEPNIRSLESQCFGTGEIGDIAVDMENNGEVDATFSVSASCGGGIRQSGTTLRVQMAKFERKLVYVPLTGETAQEQETTTCTVTVADLENPNIKDTANVQACVKGINICPPKDERCLGDKLQRCNDAGTDWVTIQEVSDACVSNECENKADCPQREGFSVECKKRLLASKKECVYTKKSACEPAYSLFGTTIIPNISKECVSFFTPMVIILSVLGALVTFFFVNLFAQKQAPKNKRSNTIIALIFAAAAGALIFLYWWVFMIIIGILIIVKVAL